MRTEIICARSDYLKPVSFYDSFGVDVAVSGTTINPFRYVGMLGYYFDTDIRNYLLRRRTYCPSLSSFLSRDPLGSIDIGGTLYQYVGNSPTGWTDPSGLQRTSPQEQITLEPVGAGKTGCEEDPVNCGRASFPVKFVLTRKQQNKGAIIQHVKVDITIFDCESLAVKKAITAEYFEAWQVSATGIPKPFSEWQGNAGGRYNDLFQVCGEPNSCGIATITGKISYVKNYKISPCGGQIDPKPDCWWAWSPKALNFKPDGFCDARLENAPNRPPFAGMLWRKEISPVSPRFPSQPPTGWVDDAALTTAHSMQWDWNCCFECIPFCPPEDRCAVIPTKPEPRPPARGRSK